MANLIKYLPRTIYLVIQLATRVPSVPVLRDNKNYIIFLKVRFTVVLISLGGLSLLSYFDTSLCNLPGSQEGVITDFSILLSFLTSYLFSSYRGIYYIFTPIPV